MCVDQLIKRESMMTKLKDLKLPLACFMASTALATSVAVSAAELDAAAIERGKAAAVTCIACHQADGAGMNIPAGESWPRLAGLDRDYMVSQLKAFKDGSRNNASMLAFANMLNDEQMVDVATYYASLPVPKVATVEVSADLLKHGEKLATQGDWNRYIVACTSCHGIGNQGNGTVFPGIAGQQPAYIAQQIKAWQADTRKNDPQHLMSVIAKRMEDRDIEAVSAWLATQPAAAQQ